MSEELRQKGYLTHDGHVQGDRVGNIEAFNLGATSLAQLAQAGVIPRRDYRAASRGKPDALIIDRRPETSETVLVIEYKDRGELDTERQRIQVFDKVVEAYCQPLGCRLAAVSDGNDSFWLHVGDDLASWKVILREDGYPLDVRAHLADEEGRALLDRTLRRIADELDPASGYLLPVQAANPTRLAEQTWQTIWLASGEDPEACLATFVEILIFKFLSDLGILVRTPEGVPVDFHAVHGLQYDEVLRYYFDHVRPEIKRLFPEGLDGTSVINGIVLNPANADHGRLFQQILRKFEATGTLRRIDPEFKSRIFERFLKKSISQKNWGQFFTPRNVIKAMVEMSGVENLPAGSVLADPACGVGGFVLEPLLNKRPYDLRAPNAPNLNYRGWDRDTKTIILAKANLLIHLSEVLEQDPIVAPRLLAPVMSSVFTSTAHSIIGSLSLAPRDEFDLVMTNPPYVVTGTSTQRQVIAQDAALSSYYSVGGAGVESLFLQMIVRGLKPGARALVVVPDGLLLRHTEEPLKRFLLQECLLEAIVSLPKDTFYSTPKKTYILVIRRKHNPAQQQEMPVFTYLIGAVGETLDAKRFPIPQNHLPGMADLFRQFCSLPDSLQHTEDPRLKLWPLAHFKPEEHWLVDRWWTPEERVALGDMEQPQSISPEELAEQLRSISQELDGISTLLGGQGQLVQPHSLVETPLSDQSRFRLSIGERVLKKDLHGKAPGPIPLYSANVLEPFGFVDQSNLADFSNPSVIWGIDGDFELAVKDPNVQFAITDHCGRIEILDPRLDPAYCRAAIRLARATGFDRTLRPSLTRMRNLAIKVPVTPDGSLDLEAQRAVAARYDAVVEALRDVERAFAPLTSMEPEVISFAPQNPEAEGPQPA